MLRKFLTTLILLAALPPALADVYRWVDQDGTVHYSDRAVTADAQLTAVRSARTDPERVAAEQKLLQESLQAEEERKSAAAEQQQARAAESAQRAENCKKARTRLAEIESAQRLVITDEAGNRQYLDDAAITAARNKARADVTERCGG